MDTLKIKAQSYANTTILSNDFIDIHMAKANGEFVKVYLLLLRYLSLPDRGISVSAMADQLNNTEKDIIRALHYWEEEKLLTLTGEANGDITEINLTPLPSGQQNDPPLSPIPTTDTSPQVPPSKKAVSAEKKTAYREPEETSKANVIIPADQFEFKNLCYAAEMYLKKTLTATDLDTFSYLYNDLKLPAPVIEYLIETCVEHNRTSIHYIRKVGMEWAKEEIRTVEEAKQRSRVYNKHCFDVLKAFGIKNRMPGERELAYIVKWFEELGFSPEVVTEACNRTLTNISQPKFEYADKILTEWHQKQVRNLSDVQALDEQHKKGAKAAGKRASGKANATQKNMNNFAYRQYDMDALEKQLLNRK